MKLKNLFFISVALLMACEAPSSPSPKKSGQFTGAKELKALAEINRLKIRNSPDSLPEIELALESNGTVGNGAAIQCAPVVVGNWRVAENGLAIRYEIDSSPQGYVSEDACSEERKKLSAYSPDELRKEFVLTQISCSGNNDCRGSCETLPASDCEVTILQFKSP